MTDYTELVKALRCCAGFIENPSCAKCAYVDSTKCKLEMMTDAAAAIEALIADVEKKESRITGLGNRIFALEKQLPKRGEWIYKPKDAIEMMFTLPKCSVCGHESSDANNYCPNCGAKMEVQE